MSISKGRQFINNHGYLPPPVTVFGVLAILGLCAWGKWMM